MRKTRRLTDEDSASFQMFLIILSFIRFCFRKPNFCVQAMSEQYLDVCCCCCCCAGGEHAQKPKFGDFSEKKLNKAPRLVQFLASFTSFYFEILDPILHVVKR